MAEWQQHLQSVFFGVVVSFLLAKLFSVIFAFHDPKPEFDEKSSARVSEDEGLVEESEVTSDTDDDWEGVESTELDETFSAAKAFVAATAAAQKVSNEVQLQLYGLYKIATEGPCSAPQPSAFKMTARAKWQAWQKLGAMPLEEAMQKYIDIVNGVYPSWSASSLIKKKDEESSHASSAGSKGPIGPVFSTFTYEEEPGSELKMDAMHTFAREGDEEKLLTCIDSGVPLDLKDSEGRTPLHWAVDRGHLNVSALLVQKNADVNAKDNEGQTALHYAAVCERAAIAKLLVDHGADVQIKDDDGDTPGDLCDLNWPWIKCVAHEAE